jgi:hypothetical protein
MLARAGKTIEKPPMMCRAFDDAGDVAGAGQGPAADRAVSDVGGVQAGP